MTDVAVVVPTRNRALRLRWLLDALERQTAGGFAVVVVDDGSDDGGATGRTLDRFAARGRLALDVVRRDAPAGPATARNAGWRATDAPLVAFTDDDCLPAPDWVERMRDAAGRQPGAVVQGATLVDPPALPVLHASPHARSVLEPDPPGPWAQTSNVLYPRALLEELGGFDEAFPAPAAEDTDLMWRARHRGAAYVGAPDAVVHHAVHDRGFPAALRDAWRWQHVAALAARHREVRRELFLGVFHKPAHAGLLVALGGGAVAARRGRPLGALLSALPWAVATAPAYGGGRRGRMRAASELPGRALIDLAELVACARGAVRHRTLFL